jgi:hypothetical protein
MRRKLIKQGNSGLTISIPKKWYQEYDLKAGDELILVPKNYALTLQINEDVEKTTFIELKKEFLETLNRAYIANMFRAGYDKITIKTNNLINEKDIVEIISNYLVGFDYIIEPNKNITLQSISYTSKTKINQIFNKQYFIIDNCIEEMLRGESPKKYTEFFQRNDNFLKRIISKNTHEIKGQEFLWQFSSQLTHSIRCLSHSHSSKTYPLNEDQKELILIYQKTIDLLKNCFLKKNFEEIESIHKFNEQIQLKFENIKVEKEMLFYTNMFMAHKLLYLASNSLIGYLQLNQNES